MAAGGASSSREQAIANPITSAIETMRMVARDVFNVTLLCFPMLFDILDILLRTFEICGNSDMSG
jgi:hypothetical protein